MKSYWKILRNHDRPVRFVVARVLMATGLCRMLTIQQDGYRLRFHDANLPSQLWINPQCREEPLRFFKVYLKPGDRVVDVGANVGDTVLTSSLRVGSAGHVIAIEAHPRTFSLLQDNLRLNRVSNVAAVNSAVGEASGTVHFSDDRRDDMNRVGGGSLEVAVERLDSIVADAGKVDLLKVDVEGYEKFVFAGAPLLLARTKTVYFEVSSVHFERFGYTIADVVSLLRDAGFSVFRLKNEIDLMPFEDGFETSSHENMIAIRDLRDYLSRTDQEGSPSVRGTSRAI